TTVSTMEYTFDTIGELVKSNVKKLAPNTEIGFHLDHGHSFHEITKAIDLGVDSVMIDASRLTLEENIAITKKVVEYAHPRGVAVQAELGRVPYLGREKLDIDWNEIMTDPNEAKRLVDETGTDALAVGIGNAHGFFREKSEPDWERLKAINALLPDNPLILHGASDWEGEKVKKAVELGINAFNIDTDIRIAFCSAVCKMTGDQHCEVSDPRKILKVAREETQKAVEKKIQMFLGKE
ncbi:MAG: class II fructose-bisphosphate aldolase, partial [Candidatus Moranbacteria bacterium]|nr:class II fructose-bisphosphate aldolase [Candidatus Moranbacteria bacterium]